MNQRFDRPAGLRRAALVLGTLMLTMAGGAQAASMTVYKTATCGCCKDWVAHVRAAGHDVTVHDVTRAALVERKRELGLDPGLASCHTAVVEGYVVEGHVPASDIERLLRDRPDIAGIAVPGMPVGSPGMEYGDRVDPYNVVRIRSRWRTRERSPWAWTMTLTGRGAQRHADRGTLAGSGHGSGRRFAPTTEHRTSASRRGAEVAEHAGKE
ncbi:MAG: DUF411 domain-containing protein [Halofilum sp. (in: g-proteobacteria)]|nr:DUF411 domain-containing protein [Halofilum sp. (in: g-proteobacteria)]